MLEITSAQSERILRITDMLRRVSALSDPFDVRQTLGSEMSSLHPIDGYVSLSRRGLGPGEFKVTGIRAGEFLPPRNMNPWERFNDLPIHSEGILAKVIEHPAPRVFHDVDLSDDPVLSHELADQRSLMAIPLFDHGEALNWAIVLNKQPVAFSNPDIIERFLMRGNLIGRMTKGLLDQRKLERTLAERERELQRIAMIQQALLPDRTPKPQGLALATSYLTSAESGGDFFDFYDWDDGNFGVFVADVSGHGAAAAVVVAMLQAILHTVPQDTVEDPADVLDYLNQHLIRKNIESSFVTAFCAKFSPDRRTLHYANAGHNRPILVRRDPTNPHAAHTHEIDGAASVPLGILEEPAYTTGAVELRQHDTVVFYTDGIVEAAKPNDDPNARRDMFGTERLRKSLNDHTEAPDHAIDTIHTKLYEHTGLRTRDDDQTIVAVRVDHHPANTTDTHTKPRTANLAAESHTA